MAAYKAYKTIVPAIILKAAKYLVLSSNFRKSKQINLSICRERPNIIIKRNGMPSTAKACFINNGGKLSSISMRIPTERKIYNHFIHDYFEAAENQNIFDTSISFAESRIIAAGGKFVSVEEMASAKRSAIVGNYWGNLLGWYSAQFAYGSDNAGGQMHTWFDVSDYGRDYRQVNSPSYQPILTLNVKNGKAVVVTDGSDDYLVCSPVPFVKTFIICYKSNTTSGDYKHLLGNYDSSTDFHGGSGTNLFYGGSPPGDSSSWINGVSVVGSSIQKTTNFTIFSMTIPSGRNICQLAWAQNQYGGRAFPGSFAEIMLFDSVLTTAQRQAAEADINSRWAVY